MDFRLRPLGSQDGDRRGEHHRGGDGHTARPHHVRGVAPAWSTRTAEDDPDAPFFNETRKYVVGSTEPSVEWNNSERLGPYDPDRIRRLKAETEGTIYVSGSGMLVSALLQDGLVDDLHLFMYPVVLGTGRRLLDETLDQTRFALKHNETYVNGLVHLDYGPAS